jgi:hypothetical protein
MQSPGGKSALGQMIDNLAGNALAKQAAMLLAGSSVYGATGASGAILGGGFLAYSAFRGPMRKWVADFRERAMSSALGMGAKYKNKFAGARQVASGLKNLTISRTAIDALKADVEDVDPEEVRRSVLERYGDSPIAAEVADAHANLASLLKEELSSKEALVPTGAEAPVDAMRVATILDASARPWRILDEMREGRVDPATKKAVERVWPAAAEQIKKTVRREVELAKAERKFFSVRDMIAINSLLGDDSMYEKNLVNTVQGEYDAKPPAPKRQKGPSVAKAHYTDMQKLFMG